MYMPNLVGQFHDTPVESVMAAVFASRALSRLRFEYVLDQQAAPGLGFT
jgi:hypothetical protein